MVFPSPKQAYSIRFPLLYRIPRDKNDFNLDTGKIWLERIPIVFVENDQAVHKAIIFFHGNAEDATTSIDLMIEMNDNLDVTHSLVYQIFWFCFYFFLFYLHINSFGGSIFDAMTAIDVILASKIPIYTIIEGATASAGTLISVVGTKRFICPSAYMLIHQLSSEFWGKMNEIEDDYTNLQVLMQRIKNVYKQHTTVPKKQMNEILKHDSWWDSEKCIEFGLVDELWDH